MAILVGFLSGTILALLSTSHHDASYQLWRPSKISHRTNFSYLFYLQVTPMLLSKFHVNWPFISGEEVKNRFKMVAIAAILDFGSERF